MTFSARSVLVYVLLIAAGVLAALGSHDAVRVEHCCLSPQ